PRRHSLGGRPCRSYSQVCGGISGARARRFLANGTTALGPLQQATRTLPIVFVNVSDPVGGGFTTQANRAWPDARACRPGPCFVLWKRAIRCHPGGVALPGTDREPG